MIFPSLSWQEKGSITSQQATLAVDARSQSDVDGLANSKKIVWQPKTNINMTELRFTTDADGDSHVVEIYGSRGRDEYTLLAELTLTGGQQTKDSRVFVDTIAETTEAFRNANLADAADSGNDRICRYSFPNDGYSNFVAIATTLAGSTTLKIEYSGWFEYGRV